MSIGDYFASGPSFERPVFDEVMRRLADVGPIHIEPVSVGIFLKNPRKFMELRPLRSWVAVSFTLRRAAQHRTIVRKVVSYGQSSAAMYHTANIARPDDIDDALGAMFVEAYNEAPDD